MTPDTENTGWAPSRPCGREGAKWSGCVQLGELGKGVAVEIGEAACDGAEHVARSL